MTSANGPEPNGDMPEASESATNAVTSSKKKRIREMCKLEARVRNALSEGRIEEDLELGKVKMEKVYSRASTKQVMIARVSIIEHFAFIACPVDEASM